MDRGVLTIEVGLSCNNHCAFCFQLALRKMSACKPDLDTEEVKRRIKAAKDEGFAEVNFTGGEPTIRKDIFELVKFAREQRFSKVTITTNGRMLAYRGFLKKLVESGLTGLSVSLHSCRKDVQDALTGVRGSFEQTVAGLEVASSFGAKWLDISTITLIVPQNLDHLGDTLALAEEMGVLLHICQPFAVSPHNIMVARQYLLDMETIVQALKEAAKKGLTRGGRIKPYNIPPCLLEDMKENIELQTYRLKTFKSFEPELLGKAGKAPKGQFFRRESCASCAYLCPGFRTEHVPQDEVASEIIAGIGRTSSRSDCKELTLAGLAFLMPAQLMRVLQCAKSKAPTVRILYSGFGLSSTEEFLEAAISCGVDEVCFVLPPPSLRPEELKALLPRFAEKVKQDLMTYPARNNSTAPSLMVSLPLLWDNFFDFSADALLDLCKLLVRRKGKRVYFFVPDYLDDEPPPNYEMILRTVLSRAPDLKQKLEELGVAPMLVVAPGKGEGRFEEALSSVFCTVRLDDCLVEHSFAKIV